MLPPIAFVAARDSDLVLSVTCSCVHKVCLWQLCSAKQLLQVSPPGEDRLGGIWDELLESGVSVAGSLVVVPKDLPECWAGASVILDNESVLATVIPVVNLFNLLESIRPGHLSRFLNTSVNDVVLVFPVAKLSDGGGLFIKRCLWS